MRRYAGLDEFLGGVSGPSSSGPTKVPGFSSFLASLNGTRFACKFKFPVLELLSIHATRPGRGAFRRLLVHMRKNHPNTGIYVENVLTDDFVDGLRRMSFVYVGPDREYPCYWLSPDEPLTKCLGWSR